MRLQKKIYCKSYIRIESLRVLQFKKVAESDGCISTLSKLMRESHRSLDKQYECSHPNVNEMIKISDSLGIGSRITGAGYDIRF